MDKKSVFLIGVIGGLVGYACGQLATPGAALAQQGPLGDTGGGVGSSGGSTGNAGGGVGSTGGNTGNVGGGSATGGNTGSTTPPANGTPNMVPAWQCQHWEVKMMGAYELRPDGPAKAVEAGWEPFASSSTWDAIVLRRCVQ